MQNLSKVCRFFGLPSSSGVFEAEGVYSNQNALPVTGDYPEMVLMVKTMRFFWIIVILDYCLIIVLKTN